MKGDFSRLRFSPNKNYTSVLQQQGRVSLDADANEQCAINDYLRTTETIDVVGPVGGPLHNEGFKITTPGGDSIRIGKGRYYVEGILCENPQPLFYADQPHLINPVPDGTALLASLSSGAISVIQVYLQVWRRLVTALDDPCLREPALGLADTTARLQTVWRVLAKGLTSAQADPLAGTVAVTNGSATVTGTGTSFTSALTAGQQIVFAADSTQTPYTVSAIASDTSLTLSANYAGVTAASTTASVVEAIGHCCDSMYTGLAPEHNPGKLRAQTGAGSGDCSCQPTPAAGYLGLENQLYRVEIHQSGTEASATFKWSRENGSVVVAVTGVSGSQVYVDSLGPDANLGFSPGQWVEISDDTNLFGEEPNQPGDLYQIQGISPETLSVTMTQPVASVNPAMNARMRRWDQFASSAGANGVSLSTALLDLENGIEVEFSKGNYQSGDHWLIPARTATGQIEWPPCNSNGAEFQLAHRTEIYFAPLACIQWDPQKQSLNIQDCRKSFPPLTGVTACKSTSTCSTYRVGDGVNSFGDYTSIQSAIDALPDEGGEVCILPGLYYENVRIVGRRDVVIHGCGWQTRVTSPSQQANNTGASFQATTLDTAGAINSIAAVFTIVASQHIKLRSFAVEAATDEAAILIDGTGTSLSTNQNAAMERIAIGLRGTIDITVEDMVLTASTLPAVLAQSAKLLRIDRNRVAMKNVRSLWPAIYASGAEIHIDRNWVGIQSPLNDREWLPATVNGDLSGAMLGTQASNAQAAPATAATAADTSATAREFFNLSALSYVSVLVALHPGGIQVGGTSTDVYILENEIEGGSRNGITLGSFDVLDTKGAVTGIWTGATITAETDCGSTGTLQTSGTYPGTAGYTVVAGGLLTNVQIHRNRIRNMGLCGIGPVGFFNLTQIFEIITTVGLNISANKISRVLLRDLATSDASTSLGYGAICIPDVMDLIIRDNTITNFGAQPGADVCGIFILHGEMIEISRNQILETRDWTLATQEKDIPFSLARGGIVILLGTPSSFNQPLNNAVWGYTDQAAAGATNAISAPIYEPGIPAIRVEHNVVRVPLSLALEILGLGPFAIVNNHLACGGMVPAEGTALAQTVLIFNMGTALESAPAASLPSNVYSNSKVAVTGVAAGSFQNVSCGSVLFSSNVCQLEATASRQREYASVLIYTPDHLIFSSNHCWLDTTRISSLVDALLLAGSLNVVGNRFQESPLSVLFSAMTVGAVNITGQNISTFCLLVLGAMRSDNNNLALIQAANQELCAELEKSLAGAL